MSDLEKELAVISGRILGEASICFVSNSEESMRMVEDAGILQYHLTTREVVQEVSMADVRIVSDPNIMMGKPVVAGTRITVELILEKLSTGESIEQILDSHPTLTREGVQAAMKYAVDVLRSDVILPIGA
jgi:uncharacterized protein (DUF433 family)